MIEALYCHIPFCRTICPFCAFAVHGDRPALHAPLLAALAAESTRAAREHAAALAPIRSLYIGGGTPSTLALGELAGLLKTLRRAFLFAGDCEIALELNPEHASAAYLAGLRELEVNRASLGVQSLDDATLRALGRGNDAAQGHRALEALATHGPENWNADLMFGAPGRPAGAFRRDMAALLGYDPPHVSLYGLDVEPGTLFARSAAVRAWSESHSDGQAGTYLWAARHLAAHGYHHYEVSNFARPGREGRQNAIVWDGGEYLGLGPGAHSHGAGERWHNARHLRAYLRGVQAGGLPIAFRETLTPAQMANEALMVALRRDSGLDVAAWSERHRVPWDARREALAQRLVSERRARRVDGRLALTPAGMLLADEIATALATE